MRRKGEKFHRNFAKFCERYRETELYCFAEFVVERLADYVDTGTTIFDIVTRYPLSPKMFSHTEYDLVIQNTI